MRVLVSTSQLEPGYRIKPRRRIISVAAKISPRAVFKGSPTRPARDTPS